MGDNLETWLTSNGFDVPAAIEPTLAAYAAEGFDFIALKLRPGQGVQAMQPVRVVTPGADPSLPLRMVAAGVGANVGFELYVIGEGRWHTQNFPDAIVDFTKLTWDPYQSRSNFVELEEAALSASNSLGWITQSSGPADFYNYSYGPNPSVYSAYQQACTPTFPNNPPCDASAPVDASHDANDDAEGGASDAASEGGADAAPEAATCPPPQMPSLCDDLVVATTGMRGSIWVTRLRARLPANALSVGDLRLEATGEQTNVSNVHTTDTYTDPSYGTCPPVANSNNSPSSDSGCMCNTRRADDDFGSWFLIAFGAIGTALILRRRKA
jgi:hypothetical protein